MSQPAEEKLLKKKRWNKKKGANSATQWAEDKGTRPSVQVAEARVASEPSSRPHMSESQKEASQRSTTSRAFESPPTPKADSTSRPLGASPSRGPSGVVPPPPSMVPPSDRPVPPNATWEEVFQFTLNSSILSGTFEDVKILACSRRSQLLARVGGVRALHANSALVRKALPNAHLLLDTDVLPDVLEDADIRDIDVSFQTGHHEYLEDSDFEDGEITLGPESKELSGAEDDVVEETVIGSAGAPDANDTTNLASAYESDSSSTREGSKDATEAPDVGTHEDGDETPTTLGDPTSSAQGCQNKVEEHEADTPPEDAPNAKADGPQVPLTRNQSSKANNNSESPKTSLHPGTLTVLVTDMAFQTLRTFIFYAYTGRVAFAPLRSQGMIYQDGGRDASQLPVCSPKSMYRLAVKYGNEPLRIQAGIDIQSKLSTQNILDELFSNFTSRYPDIQDMELNFLLAHIRHPNITIRLPWWIDRFAHGQLVACADTFGKLIHKLACVAAAPPNPDQFGGPKTCPRGCWMPTIRTQSRCDTCGYVMT